MTTRPPSQAATRTQCGHVLQTHAAQSCHVRSHQERIADGPSPFSNMLSELLATHQSRSVSCYLRTSFLRLHARHVQNKKRSPWGRLKDNPISGPETQWPQTLAHKYPYQMINKFRSSTFTETHTHTHTHTRTLNRVNLIRSLADLRTSPRESTPIYGHPSPPSAPQETTVLYLDGSVIPDTEAREHGSASSKHSSSKSQVTTKIIKR